MLNAETGKNEVVTEHHHVDCLKVFCLMFRYKFHLSVEIQSIVSRQLLKSTSTPKNFTAHLV